MLIQNKIRLQPKQTVAWNSLEEVNGLIEELGYGGGAGGGKTNLGCKLFIFLCDVFPGSRFAIGRFELKNLKRTTLTSFFEVATELGLRQKTKGSKRWDYNYDQQSGIIKFSNTSELVIIDTAPSPKDPLYTRFGGLELSGWWIDESNETPYQAIEILRTRAGRRNKNPLWVDNLKEGFGRFDKDEGWTLKPLTLETFNPEKGHIYRRFWKPFKEGTMPQYRFFVRALASDNRFLAKSYIEKIKQSGKQTIERLLHGNFDYDDDPTKIFDYDKIQDIFSNTFVKGGERYITGDIAGRGSDKTVIYVWEGFKVIHVYYEDITDQRLLKRTLMQFRRDFNVPLSNVILDYDGIGVGIVDEMECKGFQNNGSAFTSQEEEQNGLKANYLNLRSQCWFKLADMVNANQIYVETEDEKVKEAISEELDVIKEVNDGSDKRKAIISKGGSSKADENKVTIKSLLGHSPDFGDGLMERMYFEVCNTPVANLRVW